MTARVLVGETLTGRITDTIDVTGLRWDDVLNRPGSIEVTVPEDVVRSFGPGILRQKTHPWRSFLAVEEDGRIKQAGPILSRPREWQAGQVQLGAAGIWRWLDKVFVRDAAGIYQLTTTISGLSLGGIATQLVAWAVAQPYWAVPIVTGAPEAGTRTETWQGWQFPFVGEQIRQITQRATDAPDIRFQPRRRADDPRFLEWVMEVGTELQPALYQTGQDWVLDATAPRSPVLGVTPDEDGTDMAEVVWATGNGSEDDILRTPASSIELADLGWPVTEAVEAYPTVEQVSTLQEHAAAALARRARPIESYTVTVRSEAAREVKPGDYCRVITGDDPWLGAMDTTMRVRSISGDLTDTKKLEMFPVQATL